MGQVSPIAPPLSVQGPLKTIKPAQPRGADAFAQAKCSYCGLYGYLGQCQGCGAPNRPLASATVPRLVPVPKFHIGWM